MEQLIISEISKTYGNGIRALQNISLEIHKGMFGLLGPNGAGKSSLMRTIATLQQADEGTIHLGEIIRVLPGMRSLEIYQLDSDQTILGRVQMDLQAVPP